MPRFLCVYLCLLAPHVLLGFTKLTQPNSPALIPSFRDCIDCSRIIVHTDSSCATLHAKYSRQSRLGLTSRPQARSRRSAPLGTLRYKIPLPTRLCIRRSHPHGATSDLPDPNSAAKRQNVPRAVDSSTGSEERDHWTPPEEGDMGQLGRAGARNQDPDLGSSHSQVELEQRCY